MGLACAVAAISAHNTVLLVLAAVFTVVSVVLVLTAPDVPLSYRARRRRWAEAVRLRNEANQMAARAARFEADAIAARAELAEATAGSAASPVEDGAGPDDVQKQPTNGATLSPIHDPVSGLFNQAFFEASLEKRISASRRGLRPLSLALVEVRCRLGQDGESAADPRAAGELIGATLRDADTLARTGEGLFELLLEDTPENGAIWTLERVRRRVTEEIEHATVRAGVSCYPAHAFTPEQMVRQATDALEAAREWQQDRTEVTTADPED
ncbi:MAG: diguanylate cyclase domain-containing protein [Acidimicrobiales bacterium]